MLAATFTVRLPFEDGQTDEKKNRNIVEPDLYILGEDEEINAKVFIDLKVRLPEVFESWG